MSYYYYTFIVSTLCVIIQMYNSFRLLLQDENKDTGDEYFRLLLPVALILVTMICAWYIVISKYIGFNDDTTAMYIVLYGFIVNYLITIFYNHLKLAIFRHKNK